jgi:glutaminase
MRNDLSSMLVRACDAERPSIGQGQVAQYIPALARVDPGKFGAAVLTVDGEIATYGDADEPFSIQSISKVFTLTKALAEVGDGLWERVGREPSGSSFNSIVQLAREAGLPRNPLINAGAIAVCDVLLAGRTASQAIDSILSFLRRLADDPVISVDAEVARSERARRCFLPATGWIRSPTIR